MRILFDSKQTQFKTPFGTLTPDESCILNIHIPVTVQTTAVECRLLHQDGTLAQTVAMEFQMKKILEDKEE